MRTYSWAKLIEETKLSIKLDTILSESVEENLVNELDKFAAVFNQAFTTPSGKLLNIENGLSRPVHPYNLKNQDQAQKDAVSAAINKLSGMVKEYIQDGLIPANWSYVISEHVNRIKRLLEGKQTVGFMGFPMKESRPFENIIPYEVFNADKNRLIPPSQKRDFPSVIPEEVISSPLSDEDSNENQNEKKLEESVTSFQELSHEKYQSKNLYTLSFANEESSVEYRVSVRLATNRAKKMDGSKQVSIVSSLLSPFESHQYQMLKDHAQPSPEAIATLRELSSERFVLGTSAIPLLKFVTVDQQWTEVIELENRRKYYLDRVPLAVYAVVGTSEFYCLQQFPQVKAHYKALGYDHALPYADFYYVQKRDVQTIQAIQQQLESQRKQQMELREKHQAAYSTFMAKHEAYKTTMPHVDSSREEKFISEKNLDQLAKQLERLSNEARYASFIDNGEYILASLAAANNLDFKSPEVQSFVKVMQQCRDKLNLGLRPEGVRKVSSDDLERWRKARSQDNHLCYILKAAHDYISALNLHFETNKSGWLPLKISAKAHHFHHLLALYQKKRGDVPDTVNGALQRVHEIFVQASKQQVQSTPHFIAHQIQQEQLRELEQLAEFEDTQKVLAKFNHDILDLESHYLESALSKMSETSSRSNKQSSTSMSSVPSVSSKEALVTTTSSVSSVAKSAITIEEKSSHGVVKTLTPSQAVGFLKALDIQPVDARYRVMLGSFTEQNRQDWFQLLTHQALFKTFLIKVPSADDSHPFKALKTFLMNCTASPLQVFQYGYGEHVNVILVVDGMILAESSHSHLSSTWPTSYDEALNVTARHALAQLKNALDVLTPNLLEAFINPESFKEKPKVLREDFDSRHYIQFNAVKDETIIPMGGASQRLEIMATNPLDEVEIGELEESFMEGLIKENDAAVSAMLSSASASSPLNLPTAAQPSMAMQAKYDYSLGKSDVQNARPNVRVMNHNHQWEVNLKQTDEAYFVRRKKIDGLIAKYQDLIYVTNQAMEDAYAKSELVIETADTHVVVGLEMLQSFRKHKLAFYHSQIAWLERKSCELDAIAQSTADDLHLLLATLGFFNKTKPNEYKAAVRNIFNSGDEWPIELCDPQQPELPVDFASLHVFGREFFAKIPDAHAADKMITVKVPFLVVEKLFTLKRMLETQFGSVKIATPESWVVVDEESSIKFKKMKAFEFGSATIQVNTSVPDSQPPSPPTLMFSANRISGADKDNATAPAVTASASATIRINTSAPNSQPPSPPTLLFPASHISGAGKDNAAADTDKDNGGCLTM